MCMAVYGIREVRASERVSERVSPGGDSEHPGVPFYRPACSARAIKNDTVVHGYTVRQDGGRCLIYMQMAMSHLHARCMQMDGA